MKAKKKIQFLKAFENSLGNISASCNAVGISRVTYYRWMENKSFADEVNAILDANLDLAESKLMKNILEGKEASVFFFLKTKGKSRGYIEQIDTRLQVDPFTELMKSLPDPPYKK